MLLINKATQLHSRTAPSSVEITASLDERLQQIVVQESATKILLLHLVDAVVRDSDLAQFGVSDDAHLTLNKAKAIIVPCRII